MAVDPLVLDVLSNGLDDLISDLRKVRELTSAPLKLGVEVDDSIDDTEKELKKANTEARKFGRELGKADAEAAKVAENAKKIAAGLAVLAGGTFLVRGVGRSIDAASDLNETLSLTRVVLGDLAGEAIEFGESAPAAMGLTTQEAIRLQGELSDMGRVFGFTNRQSLDFSQTLTTLAADVGSFRNAETSEVIEAFGAALRGEAEPARRFGVFLSAARVEAEALSLGLFDGIGKITAYAKAQATLSLIVKDTATATGDFGRTLEESLPNQIKVVQAELGNLSADLGQQFLAPALVAIKQLREELPLLGEAAGQVDFEQVFSQGLQTGISLIETGIDVLPTLLGLLNQFAGATSTVVGSVAALVEILPQGVTQLLAIGAASGRAVSAFGGIESAGGKAAGGILLAVDAISQLADRDADVGQQLRGIAEAALAGGLAFGPWGAAVGAATAGVVLLAAYLDERDGLGRRLSNIREATAAYGEALGAAGPPHEILAAEIQGLIDQYNALNTATGAAVESAEGLAALGDLGVAYQSFDEQTQDLIDGFVDLVGGQDQFLAGLESATDDGIPRFTDALGNNQNFVARYISALGAGSDDARAFSAALGGLAIQQQRNAESSEAAAKAQFDNAFAADAYSVAVRDLGRQLEAAGVDGAFLEAQRQINAELVVAESRATSAAEAYNRGGNVAVLSSQVAAAATAALAEELKIAATDGEVFAQVMETAGARSAELEAALLGGVSTVPQLVELQNALGLSTDQLSIAQEVLADRTEAAQERAQKVWQESFDLLATKIPGVAAAFQALEDDEISLQSLFDRITAQQEAYISYQTNLNTLLAAGADDLVATLVQIPDAAAAATLAAEAAATLAGDGAASAATRELETQAEAIREGYAEAQRVAAEGADGLSEQLRDGFALQDGEDYTLEFVAEIDTETSFTVTISEIRAQFEDLQAQTIRPVMEIETDSVYVDTDAVVEHINSQTPVFPVGVDVSQAYADIGSLIGYLGSLSTSVSVNAAGGAGAIDARQGMITRAPTHLMSNGNLLRTSEHNHTEAVIPVVPTHAGRKRAAYLAERSGLIDLISPYLDERSAPPSPGAPGFGGGNHTVNEGHTFNIPNPVPIGDPETVRNWLGDLVGRSLVLR